MSSRNKKVIIYLIFGFSFLIGSEQTKAQLLSFPGAEGAGKFVTGGRGTSTTAPKVFEVTTLVDNASSATTPGTLRYACTNNSPAAPNRIIVFRVAGTIHLYANLYFTRANTTVAGQTAPGGGITIADYPVYISVNNIIVRYIRFRLGDKNQPASIGNDDAFGDNGGGRQKIIVDHCSMSWSNDEVCSIYSGDSLTIQWCIVSEPLDSSYHDEGSGVQNHAFGGIQGGRHATLHHNLYAHCKGRMPRFDGVRNITADTTDFRNNIIYNWSDYNVNGGEGGTYNVVNNYYKYGPSTPSTTTSGVNRRNMLINPYKQTSPSIAFGRYYLTGNYCFNSSAVTSRNWLGASFASGSFTDTTASKVNVPFACVNINTQTAQDAYTSVLAGAGTTLPYRDTLDLRITNDVINRTGKLINCQGGFPRGTAYATTQVAWPYLPVGFTPVDTDHDGMPDVWETQRGLNPASAADMNAYTSTTRYNNVETYLNGDTITAPGILNTCISSKGFNAANTSQWLHAKDTAYSAYNLSTYLVSTDTNNIVVSILDNGNYGNFDASYYTTNAIRTDANGKAYLNRNVTIHPQTAASITAPVTVRIYFSKKEYDDLRIADNTITALADLRIVKSADNSCITSLPLSYSVIVPTASGVFGSYGLGYFLEFQTSSFSTFFVTGKNSVLPLKLISFKAVLNSDKVLASWVCENEFNTLDFNVEKSIDGSKINWVGEVPAKNTAGINYYKLTDKTPYFGQSFYRLKMIDRDGQFTYSRIIPVSRLSSDQLFINPNPVTNKISVRYPVVIGYGTLKIFDISGKEVRRLMLNQGSTNSNYNLNNLTSGIYILEYRNNNSVNRLKFTKLNN